MNAPDPSVANYLPQAMGARRFGRFNWLGMQTLAEREIRRFMAVWQQTVAAPLVTAGLFIGVFSLAIGPSRGPVMGVPFVAFLVPGILMMSVRTILLFPWIRWYRWREIVNLPSQCDPKRCGVGHCATHVCTQIKI